MFLFLSKLLPLFVYPVGLACVLLGTTLLLAWFKSRWLPVPVALALVVLLLGGNTWVSTALVRSLEWQYEPLLEPPIVDAIVVLGGALKGSPVPGTSYDLTDRSDRILYGAQLYRAGRAPTIVVSGGRIAWRGNSIPESHDIVALLSALGVPTSAVIEEPESLNTHDNAVYTGRILEARNIERVLLVTSAAHMPRAVGTFRKQGIDVIPAPTDFNVDRSPLPPASLREALLATLPDATYLAATTGAMKEYLGAIIYRLLGWL
ncbi:hypothetical protein KR51_00027360 [Rubidibacter lacunae KORDI 51-2]|uniref:DUF218 domain-containing protein n=1 Tax=Rubidibacter lacunae KORDI 51-2 TaxID=582515 RepID=U5DJJ4_9CHRO|nr:YdcF family protein [Rubidibacter lacunae]ERN40749.1 hypothetical protein KR51_00027360 [Rubidibacter lacunae KORDI 51-2]